MAQGPRAGQPPAQLNAPVQNSQRGRRFLRLLRPSPDRDLPLESPRLRPFSPPRLPVRLLPGDPGPLGSPASAKSSSVRASASHSLSRLACRGKGGDRRLDEAEPLRERDRRSGLALEDLRSGLLRLEPEGDLPSRLAFAVALAAFLNLASPLGDLPPPGGGGGGMDELPSPEPQHQFAQHLSWFSSSDSSPSRSSTTPSPLVSPIKRPCLSLSIWSMRMSLRCSLGVFSSFLMMALDVCRGLGNPKGHHRFPVTATRALCQAIP
mmetsp:Transcript_1082/g.2308  ORF Transcript_1082/g.2308 Transcript_1082/m.2308 type:complete len:265 (-) Transcript_1082:1332-2126(-)